MTGLRAERALLLMLALFAAVMLVLWGLISSGHAQYLVPPPETAGEELIRALKAHRFEVARDQLSEATREQTEVDDLRGLIRAVEEKHDGIAGAHGTGASVDSATGSVTVQVRLGDGEQRNVQLALQRARHLEDQRDRSAPGAGQGLA